MRKSVGLFLLVAFFAVNASAQTFPSVSVVASDPIATEPGPLAFVDNGVFTITREGPTNLPLMVFFTLSGTASNSVDYTKLQSPVTIPEGERSMRLSVITVMDSLIEGEERVILRLDPSPLAGPGSGYILASNKMTAVVIIRDWQPTNSPPVVNISRPLNGTTCNAPADIHIVAETADPDGWVGTVEFFANNDKIGESIITFIVAPEPGTPITHEIEWKGVQAGQYNLTARATDNRGAIRTSPSVSISVRDTNVVPRTVVSIVATDPEATEIPEVPPGIDMAQRYDPAVFTVSRSGPTSNALTVSYLVGGTALNGIDYVALPGHVEIPAGARAANIEVSVIDDLLVEGTESVTVRILPPPCVAIYPPPPECYVVGVSGEARLLTFDDLLLDEEYIHVPPGYGGLDWNNLLVYDGLTRPLTEGYRTGTVSPRNVVFNGHGDAASIRSRDGSFDMKSAYLTAALNLDDNLSIRVQGIRENTVVYDNTYVVNRTAPTLAQFNYSGINEARFITSPAIQFAMDNLTVAIAPPSRAEARILDNDVKPSNAPPVVTIVGPTNGAVFKAPATVLITADTIDREGYVGRVEFYANDFKIGEARKEFILPPPPGEHIQYDFEWKDARAGQYLLTARGFDDQGAVGISAPVRISLLGTNAPPNTNVAIVSVTAPDSNASEHGTNTATFVIRREGNTNFPLRVYYATQGTASNGTDYLELPGSIIIPAGERSTRVLVTPINDLIPEPLESVVLALLPAPVMNSLPQYIVGSPARAAAVISDDDGPRPPLICLRDGVFEWCRPATNGQCFRIECSTNLTTWSELCTAEATENAIHYADAEAPAIPVRFYRAVPVPCPLDP